MKYFWILLFPLYCSAQNRNDVIIYEIMADPTPQVGMPNNEWIELKNSSATAVNLQNWRLGDAAGQTGAMPALFLQPDSFVIICSNSAATALSVFGTVLPVTSFPSLDNEGELLFLTSASGKTIHAVNYNNSWYQNELKKQGGWSLEMIDPAAACTGAGNWKASLDLTGATPGRKNSVYHSNPDQISPELRAAISADSITVILEFDEPLDSLEASTITNYSIDGGLGIVAAICLPPLFNRVQLKLGAAMETRQVYNVTARLLTDCSHNAIGIYNTSRVGLTEEAEAADWIVNEILFNPRSAAYDYVEFYNNSNKILDAAKLFIANRNSSGVISSTRPLREAPLYIFPGDYVVVTEDAASLGLNYLVKDPRNVLVISSLPSFPDDEGSVITLNTQGDVVDEVNYKDDWHFKLITNQQGVSLEKIDPAIASQEPGNWHSAASTAGYGTPGYKNSQFKQSSTIVVNIEVFPKIFSPDNDGRDDIAAIQYLLEEPGYVANISIFDAAGRPVRYLVRNGILGLNGHWNWDGLGEKGKKLAPGIYIILTEIFNLKGQTEKFKTAVVLAGK